MPPRPLGWVSPQQLGRDPDLRNFDYTVSELLEGSTRISQEDKILQKQIDALGVRLRQDEANITALLNGDVPTPTPTPDPVPPTPPTPTPDPTPTPPPPTPTPTPPPSGAVLWSVYTTLDQGKTGTCVGHGHAHAVASEPKSDSAWTSPVKSINPSVGKQTIDNKTALYLYAQAQILDGSPPDLQSGATVASGAAATKTLGAIAAYHWAQSIQDVKDAVTKIGPVVIGIVWMNSMFDLDQNNHIVVDQNSGEAGGHCLLIVGYDPATDLFTVHNSWGPTWGDNGNATLSATDLAWLFSQSDFEAVVFTKP